MPVSFTAIRSTSFRPLTGDQDGDGRADEGDVLRHILTINNTGDTDALNVVLNDLLGGSTETGLMNISPIAFNDAFTAVGNTALRVGTVPASVPNIGTGPSSQVTGNLLSNDVGSTIIGVGALAGDDVNGFTLDTVTNGTSTLGGTFSIFADGSFNYISQAGDTGTDTFTYTIRDAGIDGTAGNADDTTSTATVSITLSGQVWYVNSAAAAGGTGTSNNPFNSITALNTANVDGANDHIYVQGNATGQLVMEAGEHLIGTDAALIVAGFTLAAATGARSTITNNAAGFGVTLGATSSEIAGINIVATGGTGNHALTGTGFGTLTISNTTIDASGQGLILSTGAIVGSGLVTTDSDGGTNNVSLSAVTGTLNLGGGALSGATGAAFNVSGGTVSTDYNGTISQANSANTVGVSGGHSGGTLTFDGNINATGGEGLFFDNADGTYDFNGVYSANGGLAGVDILNGSGGTFTFDNNSNTINHNAGGDAFTIGGTATTANVTWNGNITDNNGNAVNISEHDSGTVTFQNGAIASSGASASGIDVTNSNGGTINFLNSTINLSTQTNTAVNLTGNTGGTINFTPANGGNGLDIVTTSGTGFNATGGGTVSVSDPADAASNSISSGNGTALNISNTNIGAGDVTFQSVNSSGGSATGIILDNTGSAGGLHVTGTGTAGSGGTIANKTGADGSTTTGIGIYANNTAELQLDRMQINGFENFALRLSDVNGFTLQNSTINGNNGNSAGADEGAILILNSSGTINILNSAISGGFEDNLRVLYDSATADIAVYNITGNTFSDLQSGNNALINLRSANTASASSNVTFNIGSPTNGALGNVFDNSANQNPSPPPATQWFGDGILVTFEGGFQHTINIDKNTFFELFQGIDFAVGFSADVDARIYDNTITYTEGVGAIAFGTASTSTSAMLFQMLIEDNDIGGLGNNSGSRLGSGIVGDFRGAETSRVTIHQNVVQDTEVNPINIISQMTLGQDGDTHLRITNNTIASIDDDEGGGAGVIPGINVTTNASTNGDIFLTMTGNTSTGINEDGILIRQATTNNTFLIEDFAGNGTVAGDVDAYLTGLNSSTVRIRTGGSVVNYGTMNFNNTNTPAPFTPMMVASPPPLPTIDQPEESNNEGTGESFFPPSEPQPDLPDSGLPAAGPVVVDDGVLSQAELDLIVEAAIQRWADAGASASDIEAMRAVTVMVQDLMGLQLGSSDAGRIVVDVNAAGFSWFVDATPGDDSEYSGSGAQLQAIPGTVPAIRIDLLTTIMHELGHQIGLADSYASGDNDSLMYGLINPGERRLPGTEDVADATGAPVASIAFALSPVSLGTIPAGRIVTVQWDSTVNAFTNQVIPTFNNVSSISGSNFTTANSNTEVLGPGSTLALDSLTLGNTIYLDADKDGAFDAGEGVSGVTLTLYADANGNGVLDGAELTTVLATTTSGALGAYSFANLAPGNYVVSVNAANFTGGGALVGKINTAGGNDPDDNVDNDDNGIAGPGGTIISAPITLAHDTEPTPGPGNDTNNTLDFGFFTPNTAPIATNLSGDTATFTEGGGTVQLDVGANATITDNNANFNTGTLTVAFGAGTVAAQDQLVISAVGGVTFTATTVSVSTIQIATYTGGGAGGSALVFTFDPDATPAAVQALVRAIGYANSAGDSPTAGNRTISWTLVDGGGNDGGAGNDTLAFNTTVSVVAVNDSPVVAVATAAASTEQVAGTIDAAATIIDAELGGRNDYAGSVLNVARSGGAVAQDLLAFGPSGAFTVNGGNLEASGLVFATFTGGNGTALVINFTSSGTPATQSLVNAVVQSLQYTNISDTPPASIQMVYSFNDGAPTNAGQGGVGSATGTDTITINITDTPENAAPVLNNLGGDISTFTEGGAAAILDDSSAPEVAATVSDANQPQLNGGTLTVSIIANEDAADDVLGISTAGTVTLSSGTSVGSIVSVGGLAIGTISANGAGGNDLVISLNTNDATLANVSTLIQSLTYANTDTLAPSTAARTVSVTVNDGLGGSDSETVTVNVVDVNDEPTLVATGANPTYVEDSAAADLFSAVTASTVEVGQTLTSLTLTVTNVTDGADEILTFDGSDVALTNGNNVVTATNGLTVNVTVAAGIATVSFSGAALNAAALQTLVDGLGYRNSSQDPTDADRVVTITQLVDSGSNTAPNDNTTSLSLTSTVDIDPVNDAPSGEDTTQTIDEDATHVFASADFGFSDLAEGNAFQAVLFAAAPTGGTLFLDADGAGGADPVALTYPATVQVADIDLGLLTFVPDADLNGVGAASVTFQVVDDGPGTSPDVNTDPSANTLTFDINPINDAPAGTDDTLSVDEDGSLSLLAADFGFTDPDGDDQLSEVIITGVTGGKLFIGAVEITTFPTTVAVADLAGNLTFEPDPNLNGLGAGSIDFQVVDDSGEANDTDLSENTLTIDVNPINDQPEVPATLADAEATEQTAVTIAGLTVSDVDLDARNGGAGDYGGSGFGIGQATPGANDLYSIDAAGASFTINGNALEVGGLAFANFDTSGNALEIDFTSADTIATTALVNEVLARIQYTNTSDDPPASVQLIYAFNDGAPGNGQGTVTGLDNFDFGAVDVNISAVNDQPTLIATGNNPTFTEGDSGSDLFDTVTASTIEAGQTFTAMTLTVTNVTDGASEELSIDGSTLVLTNGNSIVTSNNSLTVNVSVTGTTASVSFSGAALSSGQIETLIDDLDYYNGSDDPTDADRVVTITELVDSGSNTAPNDNVTALSIASTVDLVPVDDLGSAGDDSFNVDEDDVIDDGDLFTNDSDLDDSLAVFAVNGATGNVGTQIALGDGLLTVNSSGLFDFDPDGNYGSLISAATALATGAVNTSADESFTYDLVNGSAPATVTIVIDGVDSADDELWGDAEGNLITDTVDIDYFNLSQGGNDTASGQAGADTFYFGAQYSDLDSVDGGDGNDILVLEGDYDTVPLVLGATSLVNVERIILVAGFTYDITSNDANVAAGALLTIDGSGLGSLDELSFDGSAELDGKFVLVGGDGGDTLIGGNGNDILFGGAGNNVLDGNGGTDRVDYSYAAGPVDVDLDSGIANDNGDGGSDLLEDIENVTGSAFGDTLVGDGNGNTLDGGGGADQMDAGDGNDTYIVNNTGDVASEASSTGGLDTVRSSVTYTIGANIETLVLTGTANINGTGNGDNNQIFGNDGNNTLDGAGGLDNMRGGLGNDTYIIDQAGDFAIETDPAGGLDTVKSSISIILGTNLENLVLTGAAAINGNGNALNNTITGNSAANILNGGGGADSLRGGDGDDTYFVNDAGDQAIETNALGGTDLVNSTISFILGTNIEELRLLGTDAINGNGNGLDNLITGNNAANTLNGGVGADTMKGGMGDDIYFVDNAGDQAIELSAGGGTDLVQANVTFTLGLLVENLTLTGAGAIDGTGNVMANTINGNGNNNVLDGGAGDDVINAGNGADTLWGGIGIDTLNASAGNDKVHGGLGNDILTSGSGVDELYFDTALSAFYNVDAITDFSSVGDTIYLDDAVFTSLATGALAAGAFRAGSAALDADDRILYDSATGHILFDVDGVGGTAAVLFATVNPATLVTAADFIVF